MQTGTQTSLPKVLAMSRLVVSFYHSLCEAKDTCQLPVGGQISCLYSPACQGPRNCAYSHDANHSQCKCKGSTNHAIAQPSLPASALPWRSKACYLSPKQKESRGPGVVEVFLFKDSERGRRVRSNKAGGVWARSLSWCTKQERWCSAENILLLQPEGKAGLLEEAEVAAHLDFPMSPLTLSRDALAAGWDSTDARGGLPFTFWRNKHYLWTCSRFPCSLYWAKKYTNLSFLAKDTTPKQGHLAVSAWNTALHGIDGGGPNQVLQAETGLLV